MSQPSASSTPANTANIVKRGGLYHLDMLVEGRWLETAITSRKFLEIAEVADREFAVVHVNAPLDAPPPSPTPPAPTRSGEGTKRREGASDGPRAKAS